MHWESTRISVFLQLFSLAKPQTTFKNLFELTAWPRGPAKGEKKGGVRGKAQVLPCILLGIWSSCVCVNTPSKLQWTNQPSLLLCGVSHNLYYEGLQQLKNGWWPVHFCGRNNPSFCIRHPKHVSKPIVKGLHTVFSSLTVIPSLPQEVKVVVCQKKLATEWHRRWYQVGNVERFRVCTGHTFACKALYRMGTYPAAKRTPCPVFSTFGSGFTF